MAPGSDGTGLPGCWPCHWGGEACLTVRVAAPHGPQDATTPASSFAPSPAQAGRVRTRNLCPGLPGRQNFLPPSAKADHTTGAAAGRQLLLMASSCRDMPRGSSARAGGCPHGLPQQTGEAPTWLWAALWVSLGKAKAWGHGRPCPTSPCSARAGCGELDSRGTVRWGARRPQAGSVPTAASVVRQDPVTKRQATDPTGHCRHRTHCIAQRGQPRADSCSSVSPTHL